MKKKIIVIVMLSMMIMGVVSAANINGTYKGKPIVNIVANGKDIAAQDAPAVIMDGRTMVPISMLRQLGVGVTWDQINYSVGISMPDSNSAIDELKSFYALSDIFHNYIVFGDRINEIREKLSITNQLLSGTNEEVATGLKITNDFLNTLYKEYNLLNVESRDKLQLQQNASSTSIMIILDIIDLYLVALDTYAQSVLDLAKYALNKYPTDHDDYTTNSLKALEKVNQAKVKSKTEYILYNHLIKNY